jgi:hypothetical protein
MIFNLIFEFKRQYENVGFQSEKTTKKNIKYSLEFVLQCKSIIILYIVVFQFSFQCEYCGDKKLGRWSKLVGAVPKLVQWIKLTWYSMILLYNLNSLRSNDLIHWSYSCVKLKINKLGWSHKVLQRSKNKCDLNFNKKTGYHYKLIPLLYVFLSLLL